MHTGIGFALCVRACFNGKAWLAHGVAVLNIRVVSSLTSEDEARYARMFAQVIAAILNSTPAAYAVMVELTNGEIVRMPEHEPTTMPLAQPPR